MQGRPGQIKWSDYQKSDQISSHISNNDVRVTAFVDTSGGIQTRDITSGSHSNRHSHTRLTSRTESESESDSESRRKSKSKRDRIRKSKSNIRSMSKRKTSRMFKSNRKRQH